MTPDRWLYTMPTLLQRLRMHSDVLWRVFWQLVRYAFVLALIAALYAIGFVHGSRYAEGCPVAHGQTSMGVFAFRGPDGQLRCQDVANPFREAPVTRRKG